MYEEVEEMVEKLKAEKSEGTEGITNGQIKYGGRGMIEKVKKH